MKAIKKFLEVPIYGDTVMFCIADDIVAERKRLDSVFGEYDGEDCCGMVDSTKGVFGLFIGRKSYDINTVAHEIFHLTHRIMEHREANFDENHHEPSAYLNGWLMEEFFKFSGAKLRLKQGKR